MMERLNEVLLQYKNLTLEIISCLESESYDNLEGLLNNRQNLIDIINTMDYSRDEFKTVCEDIGLQALQKKLDNLYYQKLKSAREGLKRAISGRQAYQSYGKTSQVDSIYFNKKI